MTFYYLGCPIWANKDWVGSLFTKKARPTDFLPQYARVFNTVEGNNTFYGLPTQETVDRWVEEAPFGFKFAFKFPRAISHDRELSGVQSDVQRFFDLLSPLKDRLGPCFLQLSPHFSSRSFDRLQRFLRALPYGFDYAVEVRHSDYFDQGRWERRLDQLLTDLEMNRVLLDSRPLFSKDAEDEATKRAHDRKPQVPARTTVTNRTPFVRFIGRNDVEECRPWLQEWAGHTARWIQQGMRPYIFIHTPNKVYSPEHARAFHGMVQALCPRVGPMTEWPGESLEERAQMALF